MPIGKTKLRKVDRIFSLLIRERDGWRCKACGDKSKNYEHNRQGLHCSHYYSRGRENTRFDFDNCISLCTYHHNQWGHGDKRGDYTEHMINRLGQKGFAELAIRANSYKKKNDIEMEEILKERIKLLEGVND